MSKENHAVTIRQPATANLMIDSKDRGPTFVSPAQFQISKNQALLNGFFNRVATTELVLEWYTPNVLPASVSGSIDVSGGVGVTGAVNIPFTLNAPAFFTQEALIDAVVAVINNYLTNSAPPPLTPTPTISVNSLVPATANLASTQPVAVRINGNLGAYLNTPIGYTYLATFGSALTFPPIDMRRFRYLDFVSSQLTYNQDVKDSATNQAVRDVLARWYMAYDEAPILDGYGYPILMGYTPFTLRRIFNPPKQIRWDAIQPVGNLAFEVWTDGNILWPAGNEDDNWLMTLQVSEN